MLHKKEKEANSVVWSSFLHLHTFQTSDKTQPQKLQLPPFLVLVHFSQLSNEHTAQNTIKRRGYVRVLTRSLVISSFCEACEFIRFGKPVRHGYKGEGKHKKINIQRKFHQLRRTLNTLQHHRIEQHHRPSPLHALLVVATVLLAIWLSGD